MPNLKLLNESVEKYNFDVLYDIEHSISNNQSIYGVIETCNIMNYTADDLYFVKYPTHKDLVCMFKKSVNIIESNILNNFDSSIIESIMNDIEYMISMNVLTESYVKRLLLPVKFIVENPAFSKRVESIKPRLYSLYESQIDIMKQTMDEFRMYLPYNYIGMESYLKIQKIGHEENLLCKDNNGDYNYDIPEVNITEAVANNISILETYNNIEPINLIDKFILEKNGFLPITMESINGVDYYIHCKKNRQYNLYRSTIKENTYYMISKLPNNKFKSYKISVKNNESKIPEDKIDVMIESAFNTNVNKKNRR